MSPHSTKHSAPRKKPGEACHSVENRASSQANVRAARDDEHEPTEENQDTTSKSAGIAGFCAVILLLCYVVFTGSAAIVLVPIETIRLVIAAVFLQIFTHWVCGFKPRFLQVLTIGLISYAVSFPIYVLFAILSGGNGLAVFLASALIGLLIYIGFCANMIKHPQTGPIGFIRASLILLLQILVCSIIGGVIGGCSLLLT